jgi:hypothetical protein
MAKRIPLTDRELLDYSKEHVVYELWMFCTVGQALTAPLQMTEALRNALIESFVIHLRNLIDFFYPGQVQSDDVVAAEFFENSDDWPNLSSISPVLSNARTRAHKEVSHLTRKRFAGTPPEKGWEIPELMCEMKAVLDQFHAQLHQRKCMPQLLSLNMPGNKSHRLPQRLDQPLFRGRTALFHRSKH